jgi:hypothetical protein
MTLSWPSSLHLSRFYLGLLPPLSTTNSVPPVTVRQVTASSRLSRTPLSHLCHSLAACIRGNCRSTLSRGNFKPWCIHEALSTGTPYCALPILLHHLIYSICCTYNICLSLSGDFLVFFLSSLYEPTTFYKHRDKAKSSAVNTPIVVLFCSVDI